MSVFVHAMSCLPDLDEELDPEDDHTYEDDDDDDADAAAVEEPLPVLSPEHEAAFALAQAELVNCGHDRERFVSDFQPDSTEQKHAKMFITAFFAKPELHTLDTFRFWLANMDKVQRLSLLKLKPGAYADDEMILVQPSTGLCQPFSSVLKANEAMNEVMGLLGTSCTQLLDPSKSEPMEPISAARLEQAAPQILDKMAVIKQHLGLEAKEQNPQQDDLDDLSEDEREDQEDENILSPGHQAAFVLAQAEYLRLGADKFKSDWIPDSLAQKHAKAFLTNFCEPGMQTLEVFQYFVDHMDHAQRVRLLALKPGDHRDDDMILVKPSTGLVKPFWSVLKANAAIDELGDLLEPTNELEPREPLDEADPRRLALLEVIRDHLGIDM